jgi:FtsZ-binding cell division protein ZapB
MTKKAEIKELKEKKQALLNNHSRTFEEFRDELETLNNKINALQNKPILVRLI